VPAILNDPEASPAALPQNSQRYNGFNVLAGDPRTATWASNRATATQVLTGGVHAVSNALLDTPWPKLERTKEAILTWTMREDGDLAPLFAALADRRVAPDAALPATGVSLEWERLLSAPFIVSDDYGTRCSTVLAVSRTGAARFVERSFDARGAATGEVSFAFDITR
jgi:uncharacterized protein with NRDE domain